MSGWLTRVERLISPRVTAAMIATPVDSPSRPSIQLMLLIIPTIQKIVNPMAIGGAKRDDPGPERVVDEVDLDAERDGARSQRDLTEELPARPQVEQVVQRAERGGDRSSEQQRRDPERMQRRRDGDQVGELVDDQEPAGHREERGGHDQPAAPRDRFAIDPPSPGPIHDPAQEQEPPDLRGEDERNQGGRHEDGDDRPDRGADPRDEGHAAGRPGTGKCDTIARTSAARRPGRTGRRDAGSPR